MHNFMGLFSPSFPCYTSPGNFLALRIPLLCPLARKLRLWISYPAVYFLLCTPRSSGKRTDGKRKAVRFPSMLLAQSFRHLLYWHCHHFCYLAQLLLPLLPPWVCLRAGERESGKQQNEQHHHHQRKVTHSVCLSGAPGTRKRGFH